MVLEHDTMNTYKCQHNGDVAPHACHIFCFPVKNEKVYYKWNYYKSQWEKQTFPLTSQHKDNSLSLHDTHDNKSQCRDKKLQLVGYKESPIGKEETYSCCHAGYFKNPKQNFLPPIGGTLK